MAYHDAEDWGRTGPATTDTLPVGPCGCDGCEKWADCAYCYACTPPAEPCSHEVLAVAPAEMAVWLLPDVGHGWPVWPGEVADGEPPF